MKKLFVLFSFCVLAIPGLSVAQASMKIQVVPLSVSTKAQILGVHNKSGVVDAIVFTGQAAEDIAHAAGETINADTQMVIVTGTDVAKLLAKIIGNAANLTDTVFVTAQKFAQVAYDLVTAALHHGSAKMTFTSHPTGIAGSVIDIITAAGTQAVAVITNAGTTLAHLGTSVVTAVGNAACAFFGLFGLC